MTTTLKLIHRWFDSFIAASSVCSCETKINYFWYDHARIDKSKRSWKFSMQLLYVSSSLNKRDVDNIDNLWSSISMKASWSQYENIVDRTEVMRRRRQYRQSLIEHFDEKHLKTYVIESDKRDDSSNIELDSRWHVSTIENCETNKSLQTSRQNLSM